MSAVIKKEGKSAYDEELRDLLIAISVTAKRLASKLEKAAYSKKNNV